MGQSGNFYATLRCLRQNKVQKSFTNVGKTVHFLKLLVWSLSGHDEVEDERIQTMGKPVLSSPCLCGARLCYP